jgi:hypothetical protein
MFLLLIINIRYVAQLCDENGTVMHCLVQESFYDAAVAESPL